MNKKFICIQCGVCCKNIHLIEELKDFDMGNGVCRYLDTENNLCKIYKNRPEICNVEKSFDNYYKNFYTEEEYLALNYKGCQLLWGRKKTKD